MSDKAKTLERYGTAAAELINAGLADLGEEARARVALALKQGASFRLTSETEPFLVRVDLVPLEGDPVELFRVDHAKH